MERNLSIVGSIGTVVLFWILLHKWYFEVVTSEVQCTVSSLAYCRSWGSLFCGLLEAKCSPTSKRICKVATSWILFLRFCHCWFTASCLYLIHHSWKVLWLHLSCLCLCAFLFLAGGAVQSSGCGGWWWYNNSRCFGWQSTGCLPEAIRQRYFPSVQIPARCLLSDCLLPLFTYCHWKRMLPCTQAHDKLFILTLLNLSVETLVNLQSIGLYSWSLCWNTFTWMSSFGNEFFLIDDSCCGIMISALQDASCCTVLRKFFECAGCWHMRLFHSLFWHAFMAIVVLICLVPSPRYSPYHYLRQLSACSRKGCWNSSIDGHPSGAVWPRVHAQERHYVTQLKGQWSGLFIGIRAASVWEVV